MEISLGSCMCTHHLSLTGCVWWARVQLADDDDYLVIVVADASLARVGKKARKENLKELNASRSRLMSLCFWFWLIFCTNYKLFFTACMHSDAGRCAVCWVNLPLLRFIEISEISTKIKRSEQHTKNEIRRLSLASARVDLITHKSTPKKKVNRRHRIFHPSNYWLRCRLMNHLDIARFHFIFPINCIKFSFFITPSSGPWITRMIFHGKFLFSISSLRRARLSLGFDGVWWLERHWQNTTDQICAKTTSLPYK